VRLDVGKALAQGANFLLAARMASISYDTFNEYKKQGEQDCLKLDDAQMEAMIAAADQEVQSGRLGNVLQALPEETFTPFSKFSVVCERAQNWWGYAALAGLNKSGLKGNSHATFGQLSRVFPAEYGEPASHLRIGNPDGSNIDMRPQFKVGRLIMPDNGRPIARPQKSGKHNKEKKK
jgi:hypothetical protein